MKRIQAYRLAASLIALAGLAGCETGSDSEDHYQVRVTNNSAQAVELFVDGASKRSVAADDTGKVTVSDKEHRVALRWADGRLLFEQTINLNDATYVRYTISPGGGVTATGGSWNAN